MLSKLVNLSPHSHVLQSRREKIPRLRVGAVLRKPVQKVFRGGGTLLIWYGHIQFPFALSVLFSIAAAVRNISKAL